MHATKPNRQAAFTMVELSVVIVCVVLLVGFTILPRIFNQGCKAIRINCVNNLRNIGLAYRIVATDNGDCLPWQLSATNRSRVLPTSYASMPGTPLPPAQGVAANFASLTNELPTPKILICTEDKQRFRLKTVSWDYLMAPAQAQVRDQAISYFIGTSAAVDHPQSALSGDRNITGAPFSSDAKTPPSQVALTIPHQLATNLAALRLVNWTPDIHQLAGNLLLGDGSVQQVTSGRVREQFRDAALGSGTDLNFIFPAN